MSQGRFVGAGLAGKKGLDQARRRLYLPRLPASLRAYKSTADSVLPSRIAPFNHFDNFGEFDQAKSNLFVLVQVGVARCEALGHKNLHRLAHEAGLA